MADNFFEWLPVNKVKSSAGELNIFEAKGLPGISFLRMYLIRISSMGSVRGSHAHRKTFQVLMCISGSAEVIFTDGNESETVLIDPESDALSLRPMVWHTIKSTSEDCVMAVMADSFYDESDYIRDYEEFKNLIGIRKEAL